MALRLSDDRRYLVDETGRPFFWLGDTTWSVVWKGTPDQWATYLDKRAAQGFSVLQVNLLPWRWHLTDVEGNRPFLDEEPDRPNEAYFARYDRFLAMAAERGLYTCLMLIWGGPRPLLPAVHFSTEQAVQFARYAAERFGDKPVVWSLSGDAEYAQELDKWEAVGRAVEDADRHRHPTTNHLPPSMNWRFLHHESPWHDFHMIQTGHRRGAIGDIAALPLTYYGLEPIKAFVNGEPWYENHPSRDSREVYGPPFTPYDTRYAFWVSVLSGATMGHTYGAQGVWNWKQPGDDEAEMAGPQIGPTWDVAMGYDGAAQCALGANLLRQLPWWRLRPCPERAALETVHVDPHKRPACAHVPGQLFVAYAPTATGLLALKGLEPRPWRATWHDPRNGAATELGEVRPDETGVLRLRAPGDDDWVLVVRAV